MENKESYRQQQQSELEVIQVRKIVSFNKKCEEFKNKRERKKMNEPRQKISTF